MLILTRRIGERIIVTDHVNDSSSSTDNDNPKLEKRIKIAVLGIKGNQVRIGIEAPNDVIIHREEVFMRIQEEQDAQSNEHNSLDDL